MSDNLLTIDTNLCVCFLIHNGVKEISDNLLNKIYLVF